MMRAPETTAQFDASRLYGTFDAARWQAIRNDLKAVGIDLDTTKQPSMSGKLWRLSSDSTLRDTLQYIAWYHGALIRLARRRFPPPWSVEEQEACVVVRYVLIRASSDVRFWG